MIQVICHREQTFADSLSYQQHLIMSGVHSGRQYRLVGFILMHRLQLHLQQPCCRVVPLEHYHHIAHRHIHRVASAYVRHLVEHYLATVLLPVLLAHYNVAEPAERGYVALHSIYPYAIAHLHASRPSNQPQQTAHREQRLTYKQHHTEHIRCKQHLCEGHSLPHSITTAIYDSLRHQSFECHRSPVYPRLAVERQMHKRQHEREQHHGEYSKAVERMERVPAHQQLVEEIEQCQTYRHLHGVYKKHSQHHLFSLLHINISAFMQEALLQVFLLLVERCYQLLQLIHCYLLLPDERTYRTLV